jgi:hypothetical protein
VNGVDFLLGTHQPGWLARLEVPLFVSHRTLRDRKQLPRARGRWALDSGGFTELTLYGGWQTSLGEYVEAVARYQAAVGKLVWASPQDWMCEPAMLQRTGLTVAEHQARTVDNYCALRQAAPTLPFIPVLQGWTLDHYPACVDRYAEAGVDLRAMPLVGLGSVCRRQASGEISQITTTLAALGSACTGSGSSIAAWPATPTACTAPTRWPGRTRPVGVPRFPAAPLTATAPTAPAMRWPGANGSPPGLTGPGSSASAVSHDHADNDSG